MHMLKGGEGHRWLSDMKRRFDIGLLANPNFDGTIVAVIFSGVLICVANGLS